MSTRQTGRNDNTEEFTAIVFWFMVSSASNIKVLIRANDDDDDDDDADDSGIGSFFPVTLFSGYYSHQFGTLFNDVERAIGKHCPAMLSYFICEGKDLLLAKIYWIGNYAGVVFGSIQVNQSAAIWWNNVQLVSYAWVTFPRRPLGRFREQWGLPPLSPAAG